MTSHCWKKWLPCVSPDTNFPCDLKQVTKSPLERREHSFFLRLQCITPNGKNQHGLLKKNVKVKPGEHVYNSYKCKASLKWILGAERQSLVGQSFKQTNEDDLIKFKSCTHDRKTHRLVFSCTKYMSMILWTRMEKNTISSSSKNHLKHSPSLRNVL